ncbi:MAG: hypothetical protein R3F59_24710 [Myxococcota bacterium]
MIGLLLLAAAAAAPRPEWAEAEPAALEVVSPRLSVGEVVVGDGEALGADDLAVVTYLGWFEDGTPWDSTLDWPAAPARPEGTARLLLSDPRVPQRWVKALVGMRVGGVRRLELRAEPGEAPAPPALRMAFRLEAVEHPPEGPSPCPRAPRGRWGRTGSWT